MDNSNDLLNSANKLFLKKRFNDAISIYEQILKSEQKFRIAMKRSVGFNQDLRKGTKIKQSMLTFYRPGNGIPPNTINNIIGRKLKQNVTKGMFVNWNMFQPIP